MSVRGRKYLKLFDTHAEYQTYISGQDKVLPNVSYCEDNNDVHYNPWVETRLVATFNVTDTSSATNILYNNNDIISQFSTIEIDGVIQDNVINSYTFDTVGEHTVKYTLIDETALRSASSYGVFNNCSALTSIKIPQTLVNLNSSGSTHSPFERCPNLTSIVVDKNNPTFDSRNNCNAIIRTSTNVLEYGCPNTTIPSTVHFIGPMSFYNCTGLTNINIPDTVTSIGFVAFAGCTSLTNVVIPNSVTSIYRDTFANCSGLVSVTLGSGLTTIDMNGSQGTFYNCSNLQNITCLMMSAPSAFSNTFRNVKTGGTLTVPTGSTGYNTWMGTGNYYLGKYSWTKVEQ